MGILSKFLKDAMNLIGKNIHIEGKSNHVAGADKIESFSVGSNKELEHDWENISVSIILKS